jgi:hypothetical protein
MPAVRRRRLTLAVPLVCLGSIYSLAGQELTPLFGQPDWFLGILPLPGGQPEGAGHRALGHARPLPR